MADIILILFSISYFGLLIAIFWYWITSVVAINRYSTKWAVLAFFFSFLAHIIFLLMYDDKIEDEDKKPIVRFLLGCATFMIVGIGAAVLVPVYEKYQEQKDIQTSSETYETTDGNANETDSNTYETTIESTETIETGSNTYEPEVETATTDEQNNKSPDDTTYTEAERVFLYQMLAKEAETQNESLPTMTGETTRLDRVSVEPPLTLKHHVTILQSVETDFGYMDF
ncbi:MAG: hypothetical protein Q4G13_04435, partial [Moraxella sp.]|nr:hypothetical protein [Moraxella sp.]